MKERTFVLSYLFFLAFDSIKRIQLCVFTACRYKLAVSAGFLYTVFSKNEYPIRILDSSKAMRDGKGGSSLRKHLEGFLNKSLTLVIERACCLIEDKYGRILQEHTSKLNIFYFLLKTFFLFYYIKKGESTSPLYYLKK